MKRLIFLIAVISTVSFWCQEAEAQKIRATFSGPASNGFQKLNQLTSDVTYSAGDIVTTTFTYNAEATTDLIDGTAALFVVTEPEAIEVTINGLTYRSIGDYGIFINNDFSVTPTFTIDAFGILDGQDPVFSNSNLTGDQIMVDDTAIDAGILLDFTDETASFFDGHELPESFSLSDFTIGTGTISGNNPEGSRFVLQYTIDSIEIQAIILGDVNQSGEVDFSDIAPFIAILSSGGFQDEADVNEDGAVNFMDINSFIGLLLG